MSLPWLGHLRDETAIRYEIQVEESLPGVKCKNMGATIYDDGRMHWEITISGPEPVLIAHGLVDPAVLDSLPRCGSGKRGGLHLKRGKRRVEIGGYWRSDDTDDAADEPSRKLEARILGVILPRVWSPRSAA